MKFDNFKHTLKILIIQIVKFYKNKRHLCRGRPNEEFYLKIKPVRLIPEFDNHNSTPSKKIDSYL